MTSWIQPRGNPAARITIPHLRRPQQSWQVGSDAPWVTGRPYALGATSEHVTETWSVETTWSVGERPQAEDLVAMLKAAAAADDARLVVNIGAPTGSAAEDLQFVVEAERITQRLAAGVSTVGFTLTRVHGEVTDTPEVTAALGLELTSAADTTAPPLAGASNVSAALDLNVAMTPTTGVYDAAVLADAPAGYWPLRTDAQDISGNGYHGTVLGSVSFTGVAANFGGGSSYIRINPVAAALVGGDLTYEAWVTPVAGETAGSIVAGNGPTGTNINRLQIEIANGDWEVEGGNAADVRVGSWTAGVEYHVVLTYVQATGAWELFIDSASIASGTLPGLAIQGGTDRMSIGQEFDNDTVTDVVNAGTLIRQVAVYPAVLSNARILAHYSA